MKGSCWALVGTAPGGKLAVAMIAVLLLRCNYRMKKEKKRVSCPEESAGGGDYHALVLWLSQSCLADPDERLASRSRPECLRQFTAMSRPRKERKKKGRRPYTGGEIVRMQGAINALGG